MSAQSPSGTSTGCDSGTVLLRPWTRPLPPRAARSPAASGASAPSCTSAPGGAVSSAKPPPPRTTSGPEVWKAGPSTWARQAASTGFRGSPAGGSGAPSTPERAAGGLHDGLPTRAAAQVGAQAPPRCRGARGRPPAPPPSSAARRITMPGVQKPHWLAPCATKASAQRSRSSAGAPSRVVTRRSGDAADGRDAGDPGRPVDPHGAAPALALRAAAVLDGAAAELLAQRVEEGDPVGDRDRVPVEDEGDEARAGARARRRPRAVLGSGARCRSGGGVPGAQLKEEPQPQVRVALGLMMLKPAPCRPSL